MSFGRQRLLERGHPEVGHAPGQPDRHVDGVPLVGVDPQVGVRGAVAHRPHVVEVAGLAVEADLDLECVVAALASLRDRARDLVGGFAGHDPGQADRLQTAAAPQHPHGDAEDAAEQIVHRDVDRRLGQRRADAEPAVDRPVERQGQAVGVPCGPSAGDRARWRSIVVVIDSTVS